ncbi:MAG: lytic transglycosylase domain-containing protein, partial [Rhizobiales bacterium]|nr:lytic transglycosylase domain-containing protein [Hyphomicrobiales bacterium]
MFLEATSDIASRITGAIASAARATGASFDYLLKTALRESNLDPSAKATTSSATGLFQFVDQTWLETLKTSGPALGYGKYADAIAQSPSGRYAVTDPAMRKEIMDLRNDPVAASKMAAAFTQRNSDTLTTKLGRKPTDGELYLAHFLGVGGAGQLITTAFNAPDTKAADLFPDAARANRSIFYSRAGGARSTAQVYALLTRKHDSQPVPGGDATSVAATSGARPTRVSGASSAQAQAAIAAAMPTAQTEPVSPVSVPAFAASDGPVFHSLFRTEGRGAVSSVVSELWGARSVQNPERVAAAASPASAPSSGSGNTAAGGKPLDLFQ